MEPNNKSLTVPPGYFLDAKGRMIPENLVKDHQRLEDQTVREILLHAEELNAQIARFKGHTFSDVTTFLDVLSEKYSVRKGGRKGNVTLSTIDGCQKVVVQVQDYLTFGPELQVAKKLFDECISAWSEGSDERIHALVDHAFNVDKEGRINREALFSLRRLDIDDDGWKRAVDALNDSIRIQGSREYVRFYKRNSSTDPWSPITIDLASVAAVSASPEAR